MHLAELRQCNLSNRLNFIMHIFTGLLIAVSGFLLIVYREKVKGITGDIPSAEHYLGPGGTYTFFLLFGVVIFMLGLMWATGTFQSWFSGTLGRYFGGGA
ncbi:MAG: hypothetical protein UT55_C0016G0013 [Candidatus Peregrinibacteria bacterium GW2011_GWE2_39_6]|nr:MAG: hypothetical protein UT36_C0003G0108 [Candidatus Peregrinibacteria bacterium GW2011_GWF2_39_17]KKR26152.1 MAG: hypothetical protein UT55_C0016G0013 [Candidatus Peregrinibacteria bacterium GW2011_GWE2_39_6]